jgi:hypothetical protein
MNRCWLAIVDSRPREAFAHSEVSDEGGAPAGWLACWHQRAKPVPGALRADGRIVDREGEPAWISLALAPAGVRVPFDDLSVQGARRQVLAWSCFDAVSTLLRDNSHFEGAVTVARGPAARVMLAQDPFARIFPARLLRCEDGVLGRVTAPTGPTIERYGSGNPWPWDRFDHDCP